MTDSSNILEVSYQYQSNNSELNEPDCIIKVKYLSDGKFNGEISTIKSITRLNADIDCTFENVLTLAISEDFDNQESLILKLKELMDDFDPHLEYNEGQI